jgi:hypothetical protein
VPDGAGEPTPPRLHDDFFRESCLANAGFAAKHDETAVAGLCFVEESRKDGALMLATYKGCAFVSQGLALNAAFEHC